MSEELKQQIALMVTNLGCLMVFGTIAMHFGKWWIILFAALFWGRIKYDECTDPYDIE